MINNIQNIHTSVVNSTFVGSVVKPSDAMDFFNMSHKLTQQEFLNRSISVHGDKYDYSLSTYKTNKDKVIIICKKHGEFLQNASNHFEGAGCKKCGHKLGEIVATHRLSRHPLSQVYWGMMRRCYNKNYRLYKDYGGRGIKVSDSLKNLSNFIKYVSSLKDYEKKFTEKYSFDRINNDGDYEEGNLRWTSQTVQNTNRRAINSKTGYTGVYVSGFRYRSEVVLNYEIIGRAYFDTIQEALNYRNNIIISHNLPHKIQKYDRTNI